MKCCRQEGRSIALIHEFVQIAPQNARDLACILSYEYCQNHPAEMRIYLLADDLVQRNMGGYFSAFTHRTDGEEQRGLNYWGSRCWTTRPCGS